MWPEKYHPTPAFTTDRQLAAQAALEQMKQKQFVSMTPMYLLFMTYDFALTPAC